MPDPSQRIAFVAEGKLYLHDGGPSDSPRLVESPFVQGILDRVERSRERNEWKNNSAGWSSGAQGFMAMRGLAVAPAETRRIQFTGVAPGGAAGQVLYALDTDHVGGLFCLDLADSSERRLFHRQQFRARDLCRRASDGSIALSLRKEDGTAHLAVMSGEGRGLKQVTEGDAIDEAPSWVGPDGKSLVFQSAGIGRNAAGFFAALGPYAVQRLDLDDERVTTLLESDDVDYLAPRMSAAADGTLYCIRRPYHPHGQPVSFWRVGLDVLLFPYRLVRAIVHFLDFISVMFARKPLITAGGPPKEGPDQRHLMLWGKLIDAERALKQKKQQGALVPKSWELIRRAPDGTETILARNVLSFDLAPDGAIVWSNGSAIFRIDANGNRGEVCKGRLIERVAVV